MFLVFCVFVILVPCAVRYDFRIKTMFGRSLSPVIYEDMSYLHYCMFVWVQWCVFIDHVPYMLQFLWVVHFVLHRRYSLNVYLYETKMKNWKFLNTFD